MANFFKETSKKTTKSHEKQILAFEIEKLDSNGCGVAYYKRKPVFIDGTLPGEKVEAKLLEQKNKYSIAKLLAVKEPSNERVEPKCQHFTRCGGCDLQHLEYQQQVNFKKNKVSGLFSRSGISIDDINNLPWQEPILSKQWHYRRKARIGVQYDKKSHATIGFRQKSTNQLTAIKTCPVLVEPASNIFLVLKELVNKLTVKKAIGHIEMISADYCKTINSIGSDNKITLIVRQVRAINEHDIKLWEQYANKNNWQLQFQESENHNNNVDLSNSSNGLSYPLTNEIQINFSNTDFIQINEQVNIAMVEQAIAWLQPHEDDHVLDLFCGLGNFSLPLAKRVCEVVGVEGVQSMVDKATDNASFNKIDNCSFFQADLNSQWKSAEWAYNKFSIALLDPARAGAQKAVEQVITLGIPTVLYVSCEPTTLAADSLLLINAGYKIEKIGLIDMFSQTKHVETMVLFSK